MGSILQFTWDGDRLVSRTAVDPTGSYAITSKIIYDTDGESIGFCVDTNINPADCPEEQIGVPLGVYLYEKNLQGDVVKVIHGATGTVLANFSYDAYGNLEVHADDIGEVIGAILVLAFTPQLYRGYIYVPLGDNLCYYLGSRFYNPQLGRFLNADKHTDTGTGVNGTNMFTYCNNNPVLLIDPTGNIPINLSLFFGTLAVGIFSYLGLYNNMLCLRLFQWSFTHRKLNQTYDFSSKSKGANWSDFIVKRLKKSAALGGVIANIIYYELKNKSKATVTYSSATQSTNPPSAKFNWSFYDYGTNPSLYDLDLSWSIGGFSGSFTVTVERRAKNKYAITCVLKNEVWDFERWDEDTQHTDHSFTTIINNIGSSIEDRGVSIPYKWGFSVSFLISM